MAKITDGTFNDWQDTEVMHASEYKQEREILRAAVNDNDGRLRSLEESTLGLQLGTVQLRKITNDTGGVKIAVTSTSGDILSEIVAAGVDMHTFYAISGSKNLPPSNISIRGTAHITSEGFGWVDATDFKNNRYTNYLDNGEWSGWKGSWESPGQTTLWAGAFYPTEAASNKITPTKKLSDCNTGWLLVWSDMDAGVGPNDFNWSTTFVPKDFVNWPGTNFMCAVPSYVSSNGLVNTTVVKQLSITDTTITGNTTNDEGDVNDVILRKVIEV